jgi:hypothetical protein
MRLGPAAARDEAYPSRSHQAARGTEELRLEVLQSLASAPQHEALHGVEHRKP